MKLKMNIWFEVDYATFDGKENNVLDLLRHLYVPKTIELVAVLHSAGQQTSILSTKVRYHLM